MGERWPRDKWQAAVWADPMLKPNEKLVAHAYAFKAFERDHAWVVLSELQAMTGLSRRAAQYAVRGLESSGWLAQVAGAYYHKAPVYRLTYPLARLLESADSYGIGTESVDPLGTDETHRGAPHAPHGVHQMHGRGAPDAPKNSLSNSPRKTHSSASKRASTSSASRKRGATSKERRDFNLAVDVVMEHTGESREYAEGAVRQLREDRPNQRSLAAFFITLVENGTLDGYLGKP